MNWGLFCVTGKLYGKLKQFILVLYPHTFVAHVLLSSVPSTFRKMTQNPAMMFQKNLLREQSTWRHGDAYALVGCQEELTFGIDFSAFSHLTWMHV